MPRRARTWFRNDVATPEELVERLRTDPDRWAALLADPLLALDVEGLAAADAGRFVALVREADDLPLPDDRRHAMAGLFRLLAVADRTEATARRRRTLGGLDEPVVPPATGTDDAEVSEAPGP